MSTIDHYDAYQIERSAEDARRILDVRLRALTLASKFWKLSSVSDREARLAYAAELDQFGMFSLNQLSKITRTAAKAIAKHVPEKPRPGGRLAPETLTTLVVLRRQAMAGEHLSLSLLSEAEQAGTSISAACRLVGTSSSFYYDKIGEMR